MSTVPVEESLTVKEANRRNVCLCCGKKVHFCDSEYVMNFSDSEEGDIWSLEGVKNYRSTGLCEFCQEYTSMIDEVMEEESEGYDEESE